MNSRKEVESSVNSLFGGALLDIDTHGDEAYLFVHLWGEGKISNRWSLAEVCWRKVDVMSPMGGTDCQEK